MNPRINIKFELTGSLEDIISKLTQALQKEGFGVLTRIDFHSKIKEKLDKDLRPVVILGACNPQLAYEAYLKNTDVTSLLPCNVVVRELGAQRYSVEIVKPTALMEITGDEDLVALASQADTRLESIPKTLHSL